MSCRHGPPMTETGRPGPLPCGAKTRRERRTRGYANALQRLMTKLAESRSLRRCKPRAKYRELDASPSCLSPVPAPELPAEARIPLASAVVRSSTGGPRSSTDGAITALLTPFWPDLPRDRRRGGTSAGLDGSWLFSARPAAVDQVPVPPACRSVRSSRPRGISGKHCSLVANPCPV